MYQIQLAVHTVVRIPYRIIGELFYCIECALNSKKFGTFHKIIFWVKYADELAPRPGRQFILPMQNCDPQLHGTASPSSSGN